MVVAETWLTDDVSNKDVIRKLNNWKVLKRLDATDNKKHMGLLLLTPASRINPFELIYNLDYHQGNSSSNGELLYQVLIMDVKPLYKRIAFIYIRETPNLKETEELKRCLKSCDILMGDLNLNPKITEQNKKLSILCGSNRCMSLREITTVYDSQLEHVIIEKNLRKMCFTTSYYNFASDHKSIALRINSNNNNFTNAFKQRINFNSSFHMKANLKPHVDNETMHKRKKAKQEPSEHEHLNGDHLKILKFINPNRKNLCFSNVIASTLLNIPKLKTFLSDETTGPSCLAEELTRLNNVLNLTIESTEYLRYIVSLQNEKSFDDNQQHDAGEFLMSVFDVLFANTRNIDEQIFGGLFQEIIICSCGFVKESPIQKLSEVLMIPMNGQCIQSCLLNFLSEEEITVNCEKCANTVAKKKIQLVTEPSTLILQLKRYKFDANVQRSFKIQDEIECPKVLQMSSGNCYVLSSIICHIGNQPTEGHYQMIVYDKIYDCFVLLDDSNIYIGTGITDGINEICYIVTYVNEDS